MTQLIEQRYSDVYALLAHPHENAVWMIQTVDGWTLPHVRFSESLWIRAKSGLNRALRELLSLPVIALHCLTYHSDDEAHAEEMIYVVENQDPGVNRPPEGKWIPLPHLRNCHLAAPHHRVSIESYLQEHHDKTIPARRPPWSRPGWFREASTWMETELSSLGYTLLAPVEQINSWCLSCVLSAPTSRGIVYFKAAPDFPLFVNEPLLLSELTKLFRGNIPAPLSIDPARRWMLLDDFGQPLGDNGSVALRSAMLAQFTRMQQEAANYIDHLIDIGCIDRRLQRLPHQLDEFLEQVQQDNSLPEVEIEELRQAVPHLKALCQDLAEFEIPETLNHGDLHLNNVAHGNGQLVFFDWTDACIAHPFLDMLSIFNEEDAALQARLRDEYLALWADYASPQQLSEAWAIAARLTALHQAISYQSILLQLEETQKLAFGDVVSHYVRRALAKTPAS